MSARLKKYCPNCREYFYYDNELKVICPKCGKHVPKLGVINGIKGMEEI